MNSRTNESSSTTRICDFAAILTQPIAPMCVPLSTSRNIRWLKDIGVRYRTSDLAEGVVRTQQEEKQQVIWTTKSPILVHAYQSPAYAVEPARLAGGNS